MSLLSVIIDNNSFSPSNIVLPNGQLLDVFMQKVAPTFYSGWHRTAGACAPASFDSQKYKTLGPQSSKSVFLGQLLLVGTYLTNRSNFPGNGLGYSLGSEDPCKLQAPPGAGAVCKDPLYGLDCSGMFRLMYKSAGVTSISGDAATLAQPSTIEKAIKASIPAFCKAKVEDLGRLEPGSFKSGDIIHWTKIPEKDKKGAIKGFVSTSHIGIILKNDAGTIGSFQSNGAKEYSCAKNTDGKRGPSIVSLQNGVWFDPLAIYTVTRINVNLSGKWTYSMRCAGASTDAVSVPLKFDTNGSTTWTETGTGVDYNGKPISITFSFAFDNVANTLTGTADMTFPGTTDRRIDNFSLSLETDDTGYKDATRGAVTNGGCLLQVRLVNLDRYQ